MRLYISLKEMDRMRLYAKACSPMEIGGLCSIEKVENEDALRVLRVYITKQEVQSAHFELDDQAQIDLEMERIRAGERGELAMVWHSHVNMGVSPSGNDTQVLESKAEHGPVVSMIINLKGDVNCRYASTTTDAFGNNIFTKRDIPVEVTSSFHNYDAIEKEVKEKCTRPAPTLPAYSGRTTTGTRWNPKTQKWEQPKSVNNTEPRVVRGGNTNSLPKIPESIADSITEDAKARRNQVLIYNLDIEVAEERKLIRDSFDLLSDELQLQISNEALSSGLFEEDDVLEHFQTEYMADHFDVLGDK